MRLLIHTKVQRVVGAGDQLLLTSLLDSDMSDFTAQIIFHDSYNYILVCINCCVGISTSISFFFFFQMCRFILLPGIYYSY